MEDFVIKCWGKKVSHMLIDNGSTLNLCPLSTLSTVNLGNKENSKEVNIGKSLPSAEAERIIDLLKEYQDIFA